MNARTATGLLFLSIGLAVVAGPVARAQQPAERPKDEALDDLLEKLSQPSNGPAAKAGKSTKTEASPKKQEPKGADSNSKAKGKPADSSKASTGTAPDGAKPQKPAADKPAAPKPGGPAKVSDKDQELDDLLQKLGETKDEPSPDDRPRGGGGENKPGPQPPGGGKAEPDKLTGKDKETDEHLEELTGRRRKRKQDDGQRTGEVGEMIKEMRDVEEKLGKPDPGEATREQQKKIVKRIETMIEQAKRSGGQMGRMTRMVRQQGQQRQGQQQGQTGALARGTGPSKPLTPTGKHSTAGGKDIWGHLPPELRQEIENQSNEEPLSTKKEMIDRYYLSVGKGKLVREE
ncbi:MAG: hypothetical protein ACLQGP_01990 [Isosphaeraceae bacterium]